MKGGGISEKRTAATAPLFLARGKISSTGEESGVLASQETRAIQGVEVYYGGGKVEVPNGQTEAGPRTCTLFEVTLAEVDECTLRFHLTERVFEPFERIPRT